MTFEEAAGRYAQLRSQLQAGQVDYADFQAAAAKLTVVDPKGDWWQIEPASGEWLKWNGTAWVRPQEVQAPAKAAETAAGPKRQYSLLIQTQDHRTQLKSDGEDSLWVYASVSCSDPAVDCAAFAGAVRFHSGGANPQCLEVGPPAPVGGAVAARVVAILPDPGAALRPGGASVVASATIEGHQVSAEVALEISPGKQIELVPFPWSFQDDPRLRTSKRSCRNQEFGEYELLADAEDELNVAVILVPLDAALEGAGPTDFLDKAAADARLKKVELTGQASGEFTVESIAPTAAGLHRIKVRSKRPLMASAANRQISVTLVIEVELAGGEVGHYRLRDSTIRIPLQVSPIFLKLVVVPGASQGTSDAWVYAGAASGTPKPLKDVACQLDLVSLGSGPSLALRGDATKRTGEDGLACWTFSYVGMSWQSAANARFKVRAGIPCPGGPPADATWVEIDVDANGRKFMTDLGAAAGKLELGNPALRSREAMLDCLWPESLVGPLNDICALAGEFGSWRRYTGREMRDRIWSFALGRRYSNDIGTASSMNGIDFGKYEVSPIHACFGLTLAGNEEPHLVDPWWNQTFDPDSAILSRGSETARVGACVSLLTAVGTATLLKMGAVATVPAGLAAVKSWLSGETSGTSPAAVEGAYHAGGYNFHIGKTPLSAERWLDDNDSYKEAPSQWGESFFQGAGSEALKTGLVSPLETW